MKEVISYEKKMAEVPGGRANELDQDLYEKPFSYRVHYAREMKIPNGGSVVFGEEDRLQSTTREAAEKELQAYIKERAGNPLLSGFRLLEIRWLKKPA